MPEELMITNAAVATSLGLQEAARLSLFKGLPPESIAPLLKQCPLRDLTDGQILISPGDPVDRMFAVLDGRLTVHLETPDTRPIAELDVGDSVGELSLIDCKPRSAFVVAAAPSRVLEIPEETFWLLIRESHVIAVNLLGILAERLRTNNETISTGVRLQEEYRQRAATDPLTGLRNRRWLSEMLPRQFERSVRQGEPLSVIFADVDHFKACNDEHGHQAGDFVLFAVVKTMLRCVRPTDWVIRYGGEEFVSVLPGASREEAYAAAERMRTAVGETRLVLPDQREIPPVTLSLGVVERGDGHSGDDLIGLADEAMYRAKTEGRNRTSF